MQNFSKFLGPMPAKWPLFLDFPNSRRPLKKDPLFRETGYERGIRFGTWPSLIPQMSHAIDEQGADCLIRHPRQQCRLVQCWLKPTLLSGYVVFKVSLPIDNFGYSFIAQVVTPEMADELSILWAETKWSPFRRRHFKCIFVNENCSILIKNWNLFPMVQLTIFHNCFI